MPWTTTPHRASLRGSAALAAIALVAGLWAAPGAGNEAGPLAPLDMSSPRATLTSFIATVDRVAANFRDLSHRGVRQENARLIQLGLGCLDLSAVPPSLVETEGREAAVQLKEVLDRIPLPPLDAVPDAAAVKSAGIDRWRLPNT
jgi:MscS family membrane protein